MLANKKIKSFSLILGLVLSIYLISGFLLFQKSEKYDLAEAKDTITSVQVINAPPTHDNPYIYTTAGTNYETDDLFINIINAQDPNLDPIIETVNWLKNGSTMMALNLPFNISNTSLLVDGVRDFSRNNNHGFRGSGVAANAPFWVDGCVNGGCFEFDGNDEILVADSTSLGVVNEFTLEAWVNFDSLPGARNNIIEKIGAYSLTIDSLGRVIFTDGINGDLIGSTTLAAGSWHSIFAVHDGANKLLYVDSLLDGNQAAVAIGANTNDLTIGGAGSNTAFDGKIDEVKIYKQPLATDQILSIDNGGIPNYKTIKASMTAVGDTFATDAVLSDGREYSNVKTSNNLVIISSTTPPPDNPDDTGGPPIWFFVAPLAPELLRAEDITTDSLTWIIKDNSTNESGFRLKDLDGQVLKAIDANQIAFSESSLNSNTFYERFAVAYNISGESPHSNILGVYTLAETPSGLDAVDLKADSVMVKVQGVDEFPNQHLNNLTAYQFKNLTLNIETEWVKNITTLFSGLEPNTSYTFVVRLRNGAGVPTDWSPPLTIMTSDVPSPELSLSVTAEFLVSEQEKTADKVKYHLTYENIGAGPATEVELNNVLPGEGYVEGTFMVDGQRLVGSQEELLFGDGLKIGDFIVATLDSQFTDKIWNWWDWVALPALAATGQTWQISESVLEPGEVHVIEYVFDTSAYAPGSILENYVSLNAAELVDPLEAIHSLLLPEIIEPPVEPPIEKPIDLPINPPIIIPPETPDVPIVIIEPPIKPPVVPPVTPPVTPPIPEVPPLPEVPEPEIPEPTIPPIDVFDIEGDITKNDNAVIVFGNTDPGADVIVFFGENVYTTVADNDGNWQVEILYIDLKEDAKGLLTSYQVAALARKTPGAGLAVLETARRNLGRVTIDFRVAPVIEVEPTSPAWILPATIVTALALPILILLDPILAGSMPLLPFYIGNWFIALIGWLRRREKGPSWGRVFDTITKDPISLAIVRLQQITGKKKKIVETSVTDKEGRFNFLPREGRFTLLLDKAQYRFPSKIISGEKDGEYKNLYFGKQITVKESEIENLNYSVPMDPVNLKGETRKWFASSVIYTLRLAFYELGFILFILGFIVSSVLYYINREPINGIVALSYMAIFIMRYILAPKHIKPWGKVYNSRTLVGVSMATISIVRAEDDKILKTILTDYNGHFRFIPPPGKYYFMVVKKGYTFPSRSQKAIRKDNSIYHGEKIIITKENPKVDIDIPIDPK